MPLWPRRRYGIGTRARVLVCGGSIAHRWPIGVRFSGGKRVLFCFVHNTQPRRLPVLGPSALRVHQREVVLRIGVPLIGGEPVPPRCLSVILRAMIVVHPGWGVVCGSGG